MRKIRETGKLLLALLLLAVSAGVCTGTAAAAHSDTAGHWAEAAIERWSGYGVVKDAGEGRFDPDSVLTRADFAAILSDLLGLTAKAENPFTDVPSGAWYEDAILRCNAAGILLGDNGRAMPDAAASRQECMVLTARALGIAPADGELLYAYSDAAEIADWAAPYVAAMVSRGMIVGVGDGMLAPTAGMGRASAMTALDRAVIQYINAPGTYALAEAEGVILVAAGDVTLTGETPADILVTPAADGKTVVLDHVTVSGNITVRAGNAKVAVKDSALPAIAVIGAGTTVAEKPETPSSTDDLDNSGGVSAGSGSSGRTENSARPSSPDILTIRAEGVYSGVYDGVIITSDVENGDVTLNNMTIQGDLIVQGGGSDSIHVNRSRIDGNIIVNKTGVDGPGVQAPRLCLNATDAGSIQALSETIIEAESADVVIRSVSAQAKVTVRGALTAIDNITVPAGLDSPVSVTVDAGKVAEIVADGRTSVVVRDGEIVAVRANDETAVAASGVGAGYVDVVEAAARVSVASEVVDTVAVLAASPADLTVEVSGTAPIEIRVFSTAGVAVESDEAAASANIVVAPDADAAAEGNVTLKYFDTEPAAVTHTHTWTEVTEELFDTFDPETKTAAQKAAPNGFSTAASCSATGAHVFVCDDPSHGGKVFKAETVAKTAHMPKTVAAVPATCTQDGRSESVVCSVCGVVLSAAEEETAAGHLWTYIAVTEENVEELKADHASLADSLDETTGAAHIKYCAGERHDDDMDGAGRGAALEAHEWDEGVVVTAATCTTPGETVYTCKHCGAVRTERVVDPDAHDWDIEGGELTQAATCATAGRWTYWCRHDASHTGYYMTLIDPDAHKWMPKREITIEDIDYYLIDSVTIGEESVGWNEENLARIRQAYMIRVCENEESHYELVPRGQGGD